MIAQLIASVTISIVLLLVILNSCAYLIFLERKIAAWTQDRIGPNRVNFSFGLINFKSHHFGLGQALVDGFKLMLKEDYTPPNVDHALFLLAPMLAVIPAMLGWAVIPWGGLMRWNGELINLSVAPINIGAIFVLAVGSLAVYGVVVGGYASNNKYSFLGGLRATAQMLSYEIPMGLTVLVIGLLAGRFDAETIVDMQAIGGMNHTWFIIYQPVLALIFFTCVLAECNRAPFDLAEAEQELVGGYHTEYSSMKWALFFLGEYMHMITGFALFTLLFLGGWDLLPFANLVPIIQPIGWVKSLPLVGSLPHAGAIALALIKFVIFVTKIGLLLALMMLIRWTLPRFRFDQLMRLAWRSLIPITLALMMVTGILVFFHMATWWACLAANAAVAIVTLIVAPLIPQGPPVNRKIPLAGSRFSPIVPVKVG